MGAALESGFIQGEIARIAEARARGIATGHLELTGVSAFPQLADDGVKVEPHPPRRARRQGRHLGRAAARAAPGRAVRAAARRRRCPSRQRPASGRRCSWPASAMLAAHSVRATWVRNFLAAGGIETVGGDEPAQLGRRRQGLRRQRREPSPASARRTPSMPSWRRRPPACSRPPARDKCCSPAGRRRRKRRCKLPASTPSSSPAATPSRRWFGCRRRSVSNLEGQRVA